MEPHFLLFAIVPLQILYFGIVLKTWAKTRALRLMMVHGLIYLYSYHLYIITSLSAWLNLEMPWLEHPYFARIDYSYFRSWLLLLIFGNLYAFTLLFLVPKCDPENRDAWVKLTRYRNFQIRSLLLLVFLLLSVNLWIWRDLIVSSVTSHTSGYEIFKRGSSVLGHWYPVSILSLLMLAQAFWLSIAQAFGLVYPLKRTSLKYRLGIYISIGAMGVFCFFFFSLMGDRLSLMHGLLFLIVLFSCDPSQKIKKAAFVIVSLIVINSIFLIRATPQTVAIELAGLKPDAQDQTATSNSMGKIVSSLKRNLTTLIRTGEGTTPLSLYMILNHDLSTTNGRSFNFFLTALIPRFISDKRPEPPETQYARSVGIDPDFGVPFHYAADWYLNGKLGGLILGSLVLALFHAICFRNSVVSVEWLFAFGGLLAGLPLFMRSSLDFKSTIYSMLISVFVLFIGTTEIRLWSWRAWGSAASQLKAYFFKKFGILEAHSGHK